MNTALALLVAVLLPAIALGDKDEAASISRKDDSPTLVRYVPHITPVLTPVIPCPYTSYLYSHVCTHHTRTPMSVLHLDLG